MKKGFTLIELLATIVILSIITLIAVPRISYVVNKARKSAAKTSVIGYIDAVDKQQSFNFNDSKAENNILAGFYQVPFDDVYDIQYNGKKPTSGWIEMTANGANRYSIVFDGYVVTFDGKKTRIKKGDEPAKQVYPEYAYSNNVGITRVGYPIDEGYDVGYKWIAEYQGQIAPFDSEEECEYIAQSYDAECKYDIFKTNYIEYKAAPDNSWKNYLRFKLSSDGTIEGIDGCIKYKGDEHCLSPNASEAEFITSKKRLNDIFDSDNCLSSETMYLCNNSNISFSVCPYGCVGTGNNESHCDIMSNGLAMCYNSN